MLFCTSYIHNGYEEMHSAKYEKWIGYYLPLMQSMGAEALFLIDNGSEDRLRIDPELVEHIAPGQDLPQQLTKKVNFVSLEYRRRLPTNECPGWWQTFIHCLVLAERYGFEKLIHIEADFFITAPRLIEFIGRLDSGWTALYSESCRIPETNIQVICKDAFPGLRALAREGERRDYRFSELAETYLPVTSINREFTGDRMGLFPAILHWSRKVSRDMEFDYIGQVPVDVKPMSSPEMRHLLMGFRERVTGVPGKDVAVIRSILEESNLICNIDSPILNTVI